MEQTFPATAAALADLVDFVGRWAAQAGLSADELARLRLVAEELFLNSVLHGYSEDCDELVHVALGQGAARTELAIEDCAPAFDPFAAVATPSGSPNPADRPLGRLGLPLVVELTVERRYERRDGRNCIRVALPRR